MGPEGLDFHRSLAEGEAIEQTAGTANMPIIKPPIDNKFYPFRPLHVQQEEECGILFMPFASYMQPGYGVLNTLSASVQTSPKL